MIRDSKKSVSVIITCYNEGHKILRLIDSLNRQTYKDYEIIIVKDFSFHEETIDICKNLEKNNYQVLWISSNSGVSIARNIGIERANNEIIYTVDADDILPDNALLYVVKAFEKFHEADVIFGDYRLVNEESQQSYIVDCSVLADSGGELNINKFFDGFLMYGNSPFLKSAFEKANGYSVRYSFGCQDYEFQVRLLKGGCKFFYCNELIYEWCKNTAGLNSSSQNRISVDECFYEHIDYIRLYYKDINYLLYLCKVKNDKERFRSIFKQKAIRKENMALIFAAKNSPYFLLKKLNKFL